jgi:hypothetical protein
MMFVISYTYKEMILKNLDVVDYYLKCATKNSQFAYICFIHALCASISGIHF